MKEWELAVEKFLDDYKNEDYFVGAILTGSYATGNNDENSDIDVYIVTTDDTKWRERGNKRVDGFLIEYFINPRKKILSYFDEELHNYHLSTTMIFVNSKVLYDQNGTVEELIKIAKNNIEMMNLADVDEFKFKMNCYSIWDGFDELEAKYNRHDDIDLSYYIFLQRVLETYFYNMLLKDLNAIFKYKNTKVAFSPLIVFNIFCQLFSYGCFERKKNNEKIKINY